MKQSAKEVKTETGTRLAVSLWGVLLLLLVVFGCGGVFALTAQAAVSSRPAPKASPTAVGQVVTATPSPTPVASAPAVVEENLSETLIYGIGHEMQVRANWRITAVGVAYLANDGEWVERVYCDPTEERYLCRFPRPPLTMATASSFNLMVREGQVWHYLPANVHAPYLNVEWGVEGSLYRFFVSE